jgi:hypothetical protein
MAQCRSKRSEGEKEAESAQARTACLKANAAPSKTRGSMKKDDSSDSDLPGIEEAKGWKMSLIVSSNTRSNCRGMRAPTIDQLL